MADDWGIAPIPLTPFPHGGKEEIDANAGFAPHLLTHELNSMIKNPLRNGGGASFYALYTVSVWWLRALARS